MIETSSKTVYRFECDCCRYTYAWSLNRDRPWVQFEHHMDTSSACRNWYDRHSGKKPLEGSTVAWRELIEADE